ncbi:nitroreductase [Arthrobacter sp. Z4-13]
MTSNTGTSPSSETLQVTDIDVASTLDALLAERWSCRAFLPEQLEPDVVTAILTAAAHTPSWCNTQPWHLDVVSGDALERLRARLSEDAVIEEPRPDIPFPASYEGVYRDRRRKSGWALYESVGVARGDREASREQARQNFEFFGAPHVVIMSAPVHLGVYAAIDCGLFAQSFMLSAQARGVGTIAQASIAAEAPLLREELAISQDRMILFAIAFGRPDRAHPANGFRTERESLSRMVTFRD